MCTKQQLDTIKQQMIQSYRDVYGNNIEKILLYGSYARGDFDEESDIDFTAVVHGNRAELQEKLKSVWNISSELSLEHDIVISPTVIPSDEFEQYKNRLVYYNNIVKEGIRIG